MEYCGRSARVPLGNGQWSKFMPIAEAEKFEHTLKVERFLTMLRAGKQIIGLRNDIPAMEEARDLYQEERESAANTLTQANKAANKTTNQRGHGTTAPAPRKGARTMIATHTLARVDTERLQRGVEGLASGAYSIIVTRFTDDEVSAQVSNGDGKSYPVTLTAVRSFCGCNDALFRGKTCKHAVSLALYAIRNPPAVSPPDLTLAKVRSHAESVPF